MRDEISGLPLPLHHLPPPYGALEPLNRLETIEQSLVFGSILALEVSDPLREWPTVRQWLPALRSRFPCVAHILWMPRGGGATTLEIARRSAPERPRPPSRLPGRGQDA